MRAVNLIPADQRRGAGGLAGRSGGVAYVLAGGLAVLVLLGIVYAFAVHNVANKTTDLAEVTQQVDSVNVQAQSLAPYVQFAGVSETQAGQVRTLAQSRFNWPTAMRQLALGLPGDVTLTSFTASAATGAADSGTPGTAFNLSGCASTQGEIATVLTRLATIPGVDNVSLTNTTENVRKGKNAASGVSSTGSGCQYVSFTLAVNYAPTYTIPNSKAPKASSGQTVSASTPTISTAASQQTTGVAP